LISAYDQQICSAGDAQFFDTSRALGVIGIVASQSIEAYIAAIGNEHAASALLGNFTNVVAFRSTERTMEYVAGKLGDVDVWKESYTAAAPTSRRSSSQRRPRSRKDIPPRNSGSGSSPRKPSVPSPQTRQLHCSPSAVSRSMTCCRSRSSPTTTSRFTHDPPSIGPGSTRSRERLLGMPA